VTLTATTNNIPNRGVGTGTATVTVDLTPPAAPTALTATVIDRRQVTVQLDWTAPADSGNTRVAGYDVRYAKQMIDASNFDTAGTTASVPYLGQPALPTNPAGVRFTSLYIENDSSFAVRARDGAGNVSAITALSTPTRASFQTTVLTGTGT